MNKYILLFTFFALCSSCGYQDAAGVLDGYDEKFRLKDDAAQSLFLERLKASDIDLKVGENSTVHYHAKDRERLQQLAFNSAGGLQSDEQAVKPAWRISEKDAEQVVLAKYPSILDAARMVGPMVAKVSSGINGFADPGEEVWHIRVICENGGTKALFFVHPDSARLYDIQSPNAKDAATCE